VGANDDERSDWQNLTPEERIERLAALTRRWSWLLAIAGTMIGVGAVAVLRSAVTFANIAFTAVVEFLLLWAVFWLIGKTGPTVINRMLRHEP
jgi:hypothetical protein